MVDDRTARLLARAERAIRAGERWMEQGDTRFAAGRSFYGFLFIAQALLGIEGRQPTRHRQIIAEYGERFAETERLDPRFHPLFQKAFAFRRIADYRADEALPRAEVAEVVRESRRFLTAAQAWLGQGPRSRSQTPGEP